MCLRFTPPPSLPPLPLLLPPPQVFLRESLEHRLEKQREVEELRAAMIIQAHVLGYVTRYVSQNTGTAPPAGRYRSNSV